MRSVEEPAAAASLAADPVLPHRDRLLDEAWVDVRLRALLGAAGGSTDLPAGCTRLRAKYRLGESLRVTFRLGDGPGSRIVSARMFPPDAAPLQAGRAFARAHAAGAPDDAVVFDESLGTVFWTFPHDRKLEGVDALLRPPATQRDAFVRPWVASELMAYSPEKAATSRCLDARGDTLGYAKVALGDEGACNVATLASARRALRRDGGLRLPRAIGYYPDLHLALYTAAPGRPLHGLDRSDVPQAMSWLGRALGELHAAPPDGLVPFTRLGPERVATAGALVSLARPDLAPLVRRLVQALGGTVPAPDRPVLLHGDLHPKNVLVHGTGVSLVDLDQAAGGPAAAEVGGLLGRLWCPRPTDGIDPDTAHEAEVALLGAYGVPLKRADLLWYAAAALLVERAARAVNRVHIDTLGELDVVLTSALRWAEAVPRWQR